MIIFLRPFSLGGLTVWPTKLKFGMEDHINPWEVTENILFRYPYLHGPGPKNWVLGSVQPK